MRREHIRAVPSWRRGPARYDCIFVNTDPSEIGMRGLDVARVRLFFSFMYDGIKYPCALVRWFSRIGDEPDEDSGMWMVQPDSNADGSPSMAVIHLDTVVRAAHLIGVYGDHFLPRGISLHNSLTWMSSIHFTSTSTLITMLSKLPSNITHPLRSCECYCQAVPAPNDMEQQKTNRAPPDTAGIWAVNNECSHLPPSQIIWSYPYHRAYGTKTSWQSSSLGIY
jgi:hypothetical protein